MNTIKNLLLLACLAVCFTACKKTEPFDAEKQFQSDTTAIRQYIVANKLDFKKDPSGVFYQVIEPGTGSVTYQATTSVTANYTGKLLNGSIFDTTTGRGPATFTLGQVITGWQIGVPYIQKGGTIRLLIPSYFGYGNSSTGSIPENSILDFTIALADVK